jgi:RNA polymerase sigma factor (sigma-70 family)
MDHCRAKMREEQQQAGSLDDTIDGKDGGTLGKFDHAIAEKELQDIMNKEVDRIAQWAARERAEEVKEALDQFKNQEMAEVMRLTYLHKRSVKEIMDELGISQANVYTQRLRGLKKLKKFFDDDGEADDKTNGDE